MINIVFKIKSLGGCVFQPMQNYLRNPEFRKRTRYAKSYKKYSVDNRIVLYEAYFGRGMIGNPYAIFKELWSHQDYKKIKHVWVLDNLQNHSNLLKKYERNKRILFVEKESKEYFKYLSKARYLINNVSFPNYFTKKKEQIYLNTWHGIPLKTLGFDLPDGKREVSNILRNFMLTDYILSANEFLTEVYKKAYKLEGLYEGEIIEEGYPRLDLLINTRKEDIINKLRECGVSIDENKKIILYAPTWRGSSYANAIADVSGYFEFKEKIESKIDTNKYQILIKIHQRVYQLAKDKLTDNYFVPSTIDANEIMSITDILISDFSSIFYDFLETNKPVLFYIPDLEEYKKERGIYNGCESLPGPYTDSMEEITQWIENIEKVQEEWKEKYEEVKRWSNVGETGGITAKIIDIVFAKNCNYRMKKISNEKKRILFFRGAMRMNGISTSFINLLKEIDYEKYDVSALITPGPASIDAEQVKKINDNVRVFYRNAPENYTLGESVKRYYLDRNPKKNMIHSMFARELKRCFGFGQFDYIIDFDGYWLDLQKFIIQDEQAQKVVWQHNDMMAECKLKYPELEKVFQLYPYFDKVVSCSKDIMKVNRDNIGDVYCAKDKFDYAKNFIDIERVQKGCQKDVMRVYNGIEQIGANEQVRNQCIKVKLIPFIPDTNEEGQRNYRFVTIGRLSLEKNHASLLDAFYSLYRKEKNVYLYIIGDGPLKEELQSKIQTLHLESHAFLIGNIENPFSIMKYCDCFILPSLHEGQPMVVNEARVMKMPIILSDFSSVRGVCIDNGQYVVGTSAEEIEKGMAAYIQGKVSANYDFDMNQYNREAYNEFLHAIGER